MNDPKVEKQKPVPPFVQFCCAAIPQVFDDSLSYYEALCAMWKYLDETVKVINNNAMVTEDFIAKVNELHDYVEHYFDNLDVQEEINNKLDDMAEQGTLQEIITQYIQANVAWTFDTVADMKLAENLIAGSYAQTLGFHTINDGGGATYYITDSGTANEMDVIAVGDLYANLVLPRILTPEMFGAYGDNLHDDTNALKRCIEQKHKIVGNKDKIYKYTSIYTDVNYIYLDGLNLHTNSVGPSSAEIPNNTYKRSLQFESKGNFTFVNCHFTTEADQDSTTTWLSEYTVTPCSNVCFLQFNTQVDNLNIDRCTFTNGIFDIWVFYSSEVLDGNVNVTNCVSNNSCIFLDTRWVKYTYVNNCIVNQGSNATGASHCLYFTFGHGMNISVENCTLNRSTNGGTTLDIYHGDAYEVYINNTNLESATTDSYALLCCGHDTKANIENCKVKGAYLIYQGEINANTLVRFINCDIQCNTLNKNVITSELACEFDSCTMTFKGSYYNAGMVDKTNPKLTFKDCIIYFNPDGTAIRNLNMKFIRNTFFINPATTNSAVINFQNAGLCVENYFENISESVVMNLNFLDGTANATTFVNNITKNMTADKFYNGTEINTTVIA